MRISQDQVFSAVEQAAPEELSLREIARELSVPPSMRGELRRVLRDLEQEGRIETAGTRTWRLPLAKRKAKRAEPELAGVMQVARKGFAFVRLESDLDDVFISEPDQGDALDGDRVEVEITRMASRGPRGRVVRVLERAHKTIVGQFQPTGRQRGEVSPRSSSLDRRITVPLPKKELGVEPFDWVVVEVTEFTRNPDPLHGRIVERLGQSEDRGIDVLLLLRDRGMQAEFPESVERAAANLSMEGEADARRRDLRDLGTVTIDPSTAKDFDDALSIEKIKGGWRMWVHIADVGHFVRPGSAIDLEAHERSTSVYPVDRVIPMLPEKLSNDLCSLVPHADRFAMTAEMEVDRAGKLVKYAVYPSLIHSNHRLAYEEAQEFFDALDGKEGAEKDGKLEDVEELLREARLCARALRKRRFSNGALDLDVPETVIMFHEDGQVARLGTAARFEAHKLVEDCMLAANEAAARLLTENEYPLLYRVHEPADPEKLQHLKVVLGALGVDLPVSKKGMISPKDLQKTIESLGGRQGAGVLRRFVLRAMQRADYRPKNAGHFGLASECYCHFTSPIRRYPDVIVHRQLRALDAGGPPVYDGKKPDDMEELAALGRHTSFKEREAADAESESIMIKAVEYLKQYEGDEFEGLVTGVQPFGMFVELEPHAVEGLVHISKFPGDDRYELDELGIALVSQHGGGEFRVTDRVKVRLVKADPWEGQLDLDIVESGRGGPKKRKRGGKPFYRNVPKGGGKKAKGGGGKKGRRK